MFFLKSMIIGLPLTFLVFCSIDILVRYVDKIAILLVVVFCSFMFGGLALVTYEHFAR